jgi:hypothetical protein
MPELPDNYESVLNEARYRKKFSIVRWEIMIEKINAVLDGENPEGFEKWTREHAKKLQEDLAKG